jgi:CRP/FNR family transcriptional regulator
MQPPFHRLAEFASLPPRDLEIVKDWSANQKIALRGTTIRREGEPVTGVFFLMAGWVSSSIMLRDGRRQIVKVHLPGDMLGLPSLALSVAGETLEAITDATICFIPSSSLGRIFEQSARLTAGLFLSTQKERIALMQQLSWVGTTSAQERMSAFLLDLHSRLDAAGLVTDRKFDFPLTQQFIGELLGLTSVHVNRTLRRLDATGLIVRERNQILIVDIEGLHSLTPHSPPKYAGETGWQRLYKDPLP